MTAIVHHVGFTVSDLERALGFWEGALGMRQVMRQERRGDTVRTRPRDVGFAHVAVRCDDIDALLPGLVEAGGTPFGEVVEVDGGANKGAKAIYVRDPDGHVLELFSPPPPAEAAR